MTTLLSNKKCPYDLDSFVSFEKSHGQHRAPVGLEAYIRITKSASKSTSGDYYHAYLVVNEDVRELISCVFGTNERFRFMVNEYARIFAIVPSAEGALLPIKSRKNKSTKIRQMSIIPALPMLRKMFGDDAVRVELSVEYYDDCVAFKPTGQVVCK